MKAREITIGKYYKLKKKIGKGAFGEIYKSVHSKTQEEYAVKLEEKRCKFP